MPGFAVQVGRTRSYVPTEEDIGARLCVTCRPMRGAGAALVTGPLFQCVSAGPVAAFPTAEPLLGPLLARHRARPPQRIHMHGTANMNGCTADSEFFFNVVRRFERRVLGCRFYLIIQAPEWMLHCPL